MPRLDADTTGAERAPLSTRVLSRLPSADRERTRMRVRQRSQRLAALAAGLLGLAIFLASATSNLATHSVAWALAVDTAWGAAVRVLLGGLGFLPALSAACMCLVAFLLWRRLIQAQNRGVR